MKKLYKGDRGLFMKKYSAFLVTTSNPTKLLRQWNITGLEIVGLGILWVDTDDNVIKPVHLDYHQRRVIPFLASGKRAKIHRDVLPRSSCNGWSLGDTVGMISGILSSSALWTVPYISLNTLPLCWPVVSCLN